MSSFWFLVDGGVNEKTVKNICSLKQVVSIL